jgi:hypothetical protein
MEPSHAPETSTDAAARRRARRAIAGTALVLVICAGLVVHTALPDTAASDIAGDALYAAAAYLGIALIAPGLPAIVVGAIAASWCVAVELFQLTGVPLQAGAEFPPAMLLLGTVFDARDLVVYLVTVASVSALDAVASGVGRRTRNG